MDQLEASERLAALRTSALERYALRCFWNVPATMSDEGVARRLRTYGDLAACRLADRLEDAAKEVALFAGR